MATRSSGKSGSRNGSSAASAAVAATADLNPARSPELDAQLDAELAALLDSETTNAETPTPAAPASAAAPVLPLRDGGDVPGSFSTGPASSPPSTGSYLSTLPDRPLPATKRFGAIILDAPVRSTRAELVPGLPDPRAVPPGPGQEGEAAGPLPALIVRTEDQKSSVIKRLDTVRDTEWQRKFHAQIDKLYKEVSEEFTTPPDVAQKLLEMLREARQLMIDTPEEFGNAEYRVMQVATAVERRRQSHRHARFLGPWLFTYLAFWMAAFTVGLIFASQATEFVRLWGRIAEPQLANVGPIFNTMLWGGIGGVVGGLYALWYHIADRQDFNKQYSMWYYVQPLMGLVLGAITFLILAGGFLIVQVNITDASGNTGARLIPYLVALLAGFKQDFVYDQLERLVAVFVPGVTAKNAASK